MAAERKRLLAIREVPYRERLIAVARKYLDDPRARGAALRVLAFQGMRSVDSVDVFEELVGRERYRYEFWYVLAGLRDPRTIQYAREQYFAIRSGKKLLQSNDRRQLLDILDCLLLFRNADSRAVLREIMRREEDPELEKYIKESAGF